MQQYIENFQGKIFDELADILCFSLKSKMQKRGTTLDLTVQIKWDIIYLHKRFV